MPLTFVAMSGSAPPPPPHGIGAPPPPGHAAPPPPQAHSAAPPPPMAGQMVPHVGVAPAAPPVNLGLTHVMQPSLFPQQAGVPPQTMPCHTMVTFEQPPKPVPGTAPRRTPAATLILVFKSLSNPQSMNGKIGVSGFL